MYHQAETLACFQSAITPSIIRNKTKLATQLTVIASAFCACARETGHADQPVISVDLRKVACQEAFRLFRAKSKNPHPSYADPRSLPLRSTDLRPREGSTILRWMRAHCSPSPRLCRPSPRGGLRNGGYADPPPREG